MKWTYKKVKRLCMKSATDNQTTNEANPIPRFYRHLSYYLTPLFLYLRVSANQASILAIIVGLIGASLFISTNFYVVLAGLILYFINVLLDFIDGNIARATNTKSTLGIYLDVLNHGIVVPTLFIAMGIHSYRLTGQEFYVLAGIFAGLGNMLSSIMIFAHKVYYPKKVSNKTMLDSMKQKKGLKYYGMILYRIIFLRPIDLHFEILIVLVLLWQIKYFILYLAIAVPLRALAYIYLHYMDFSRLIKEKSS